MSAALAAALRQLELEPCAVAVESDARVFAPHVLDALDALRAPRDFVVLTRACAVEWARGSEHDERVDAAFACWVDQPECLQCALLALFEEVHGCALHAEEP